MLRLENSLFRSIIVGFGMIVVMASFSACQADPHNFFISRTDGRYVVQLMPCERATIDSVTVFDAARSDETDIRSNGWYAVPRNEIGTSKVYIFENNDGYNTGSDFDWKTIQDFEINITTVDRKTTAILRGRLKELKPDEALTSRGIVPLESITNATCNR